MVPSASEDEDEDTGNGMWVRNLLYLLMYQDQKVVKSRGGWLADQVISQGCPQKIKVERCQRRAHDQCTYLIRGQVESPTKINT